MNAKYFYWWLSTIAKKLGMWGLLGLFLVIASLVFYAINIPKAKQKIAMVKTEQVNQTKQHAQERNADQPTVQNAEEEVDAFYRRFPTVDALPTILAKLNHIANKQSILLSIGDYRYKEVKAKKKTNTRELTNYKIVFPVEGPYTNIRRFVSDALKAFPEMALMDFQVVRDDSNSRMVAARLEFVVFVKGESWQM
jgi:Tfp pilus assembly protein PilO